MACLLDAKDFRGVVAEGDVAQEVLRLKRRHGGHVEQNDLLRHNFVIDIDELDIATVSILRLI